MYGKRLMDNIITAMMFSILLAALIGLLLLIGLIFETNGVCIEAKAKGYQLEQCEGK